MHSYHYCSFIHLSETSQSRIFEKTTETYEISRRNPVIMYYIKCIQKSCLKWYVDAPLAVHLDFESHTGARLTMGKGGIISVS